VSGIKLTFSEGKLVEWEAKVGQKYLDKFLVENPSACFLGEVALGLHPKIQRVTKQVLFDEKIGGTVHIALGSAYHIHVSGGEDKSQLNESPVNWDMIRDMRKPSAYVMIDDKYKLTWNLEAGRWCTQRLHQ